MIIDLTGFNLAPETSLLVVTNMQNEYCRPGGLCYTPANEASITPIKRLVDQARDHGVPIIYVQSVRTQQEPSVTVWGYDSILQEGTWNAQFVDELLPGEDNEFVVQKHGYDPFHHTKMNDILRRLVPQPTEHYAVITGVPSNVDLEHTVHGFHQRDYWTIVPIDCTAGTPGLHEGTLKQFTRFAGWNIFPSRSDLLVFRQRGTGSGKLTDPGQAGRILYR